MVDNLDGSYTITFDSVDIEDGPVTLVVSDGDNEEEVIATVSDNAGSAIFTPVNIVDVESATITLK